MKQLTILLFSITLHAATYYVSNAGLDSNDGSVGAPWVTLQYAVNHVACGDTIMVVANGSYVAGDANLPAFPNCGLTTTIQSSALAQFAPIGYRTNPATDNLYYGKLSFRFQGINAQAEVHGNTTPTYGCTYLQVSVTIANPGVFTIPCPTNGGLSNGSVVEFEVLTTNPFPSVAIPAPLVFQQHYYVVNCSVTPACGSPNSTFSVAATPGGPAINITACDSNCQIRTQMALPVSVDLSSNTFTSPDPLTLIGNGTPIVFSAAGAQSYGTLPSPLKLDTIYYVINVSGRTFQVSETFGGSQVRILADGVGILSIANTNVPHNWAFRGLEFAPNGGALLGYLLQLGGGTELSIYGMPSNMEADRLYMHGNDTPALGSHQSLARCISENGYKIYVHDSYCSGATYSEAQAVLGIQSQGAVYENNFLEGSTENVMCGGEDPSGGLPCQHHRFVGNYFYKPPVWKYLSGIGVASGPCLYDNTDPQRSGGEWWQDIGPQVNVNVGGGDSAAFTVSQSGGIITGITLIGGGESYTNGTYTTNFNSMVGSGASASITASGGVITSGTLLAGGSGYSPPQLYQCQPTGLWASVGGAASYTSLSFKDLAEHKNGRDFIYVGNLFRYAFAGGQYEVFNNSNESNDSGPGAANDSIIIQNNAIFDSFVFSTRSSRCLATVYMPCVFFPYNHVTSNNLFVLNPLVCGVGFATIVGSCGYRPNQDTWGVYNTTLTFQGDTKRHNTFWSPDSCCVNGAAQSFFGNQWGSSFNLINQANYFDNINVGDFIGDASGVGGGALANYFTHSTFSHNAQKSGRSGNYGSVGGTNSWSSGAFPANNPAIKFMNDTGDITGDYRLDPASNFSAAGGCVTLCSSDGTDLGADIDLINMATSGAAAGTPPWDAKAGLRVNPGSTQLVFRYTSPTAEACTATIYSAPARIAGNQVASVADSSPNSVSDVLTRELYISGLQPATQYWYKLACGGGVLMVGNLFTRAPGAATLQFGFDWNSPTPMQYSSSPSMSNPVSLTAATRQFVPVAANSVVYVQSGVAGPISILIAP